MNSNMMNRNSMGCINRGGMNQRDMGSMCRRQGMDSNNGCDRSDSMPDNNSCNRSGNMNGNNSCGRSGNMNDNNSCGRSGNMAGNNGCGRSGNMNGNNSCGRSGNMAGNNSCGRSGNMNDNNGCGRSGNMNGNNSCGCSGNMNGNNSCGRSGNMNGNNDYPGNTSENNGCCGQNEQQLTSMNKNQLLNYLNQVSFSMYDTVLFLDTHPTDQEAIAYFNEMKQARKSALKIYQKKFAPLLLDGVDANCEWTWGMEPLPWENC